MEDVTKVLRDGWDCELKIGIHDNCFWLFSEFEYDGGGHSTLMMDISEEDTKILLRKYTFDEIALITDEKMSLGVSEIFKELGIEPNRKCF